MQKARQQHGEFNFTLINRVHVPVAYVSLLFLVLLLGEALARGRFHAQARLAATILVAIVANAFACGALSGPHDRYGARVAWLATLWLSESRSCRQSRHSEADRETVLAGNLLRPAQVANDPGKIDAAVVAFDEALIDRGRAGAERGRGAGWRGRPIAPASSP